MIESFDGDIDMQEFVKESRRLKKLFKLCCARFKVHNDDELLIRVDQLMRDLQFIQTNPDNGQIVAYVRDLAKRDRKIWNKLILSIERDGETEIIAKKLQLYSSRLEDYKFF